MKKLSGIAILATAFALNAVEKPFYGNSRPPRKIQVAKKNATTLKADNTVIVYASEASKTTCFAAEELNANLQKIFGRAVIITNKPVPGKTNIFVGISKYSKAAGIDDSKLCRDAFIIKTVKGNIYILGRDSKSADPQAIIKYRQGVWGQLFERGSLFGVYDFLERFCGVRFYYPGKFGTIIPQKQCVAIPETDIFDRPDFEARNVSIYSGWCEDSSPNLKNPYAYTISPMKERYYWYLRLQTRYVPNNHGLRMLEHIKRFGKDHPEYFALRSDGQRYCQKTMTHTGQLCFNSKIVDEIYQDAAALLSNKPASSRGISRWNRAGHQMPTDTRNGIFGFMPQDGFYACRCPECQKYFSAGAQSTSNFIWGKVAQIGFRLQKNKIPGYISMMSYYPYHLVPDIKLPSNVLVMLAAQGPWSTSAMRKYETELIRAWNKKLNSKVWLWNYPGKFGILSLPGIPDTTPHAIGSYYQELKNDICGAYMNSATDRMIYHALNYYVFSKVAWNTSTDVDGLLKEYYQLMYGKAAIEMSKIFDSFERLWREILSKSITTKYGPTFSPPSDYKLWTKIYSPKTLKKLAETFKRAEQLVSDSPAELKRIKYTRKMFLKPLLAAASSFFKDNDAISHFHETFVNDSKNEKSVNLMLLPFEKIKKPVKTELRIINSAEKLTFLFNCEEPEMKRVVAPNRKHDDKEIWCDNNVELFIDPEGTRKNYRHIIVSSSGSLADRAVINHGTLSTGDYSWNSNANVKITPNSRGFLATVTIPKASLGKFNSKGFVANFTRRRQLNNSAHELYSWSRFLQHDFNEIRHFGKLLCNKPEGTGSIVADGGFEVKPKNSNLYGKWVKISRNRKITKAEVVTDNSVFGNKSLLMDVSDLEFNHYFQVRQYLPQLKPNTSYELSYYLKTENVIRQRSIGGAFIVLWNGKNHYFPKRWISGTNNWIRLEFKFKTKAEPVKQKPYIGCGLYFATGRAWFDGIVLKEIPSSAAKK